jgi:hypothetical protein
VQQGALPACVASPPADREEARRGWVWAKGVRRRKAATPGSGAGRISGDWFVCCGGERLTG